jgi:hypothetical protein
MICLRTVLLINAAAVAAMIAGAEWHLARARRLKTSEVLFDLLTVALFDPSSSNPVILLA